MLLEQIVAPDDLKTLTPDELERLCAQLRSAIIGSVSRNGGHLASNLGAVELTVALHRVFDLRRSPVIFDVGHQCYAHKLLTGRRTAFERLRQTDGCSGFPNPAESEYDCVVGGHAGTAISAALGIGAARELTGNSDKVIAVVGDGALGNGISFEALNASGSGGKNLLVVLNDNRMSISPNVGALSRRLNRLISGNFYNRTRNAMRNLVRALPRLHKLARHFDDVIKLALLPPGALFQEFGFRFFGPVDGHCLPDLIAMLERIRHLEGPLLLYTATRKGRGAEYAERAPTVYHGIGAFEPESGKFTAGNGGFSAAFGEWICRRAATDERIVAVSAAMIPGVGLAEFAREFPRRCFDVGIAEEHAAVFASGLARAGKRPFCALYATFAQRALDCVYHDAVLGKLPVVFVLDRAGAVPDGPTHHGIYDLGFLRGLPGLTILAPRDEAELALMLDFTLTLPGPAVIRYPRGGAAGNGGTPAPLIPGRAEVLRTGSGPVIWALGAECATAERVAELLAGRGVECTVINTRFVAPFDGELARRYADRLQVTVEDHRTAGGLASALAESLSGTPHAALLAFGWGDAVIPHGAVEELRRAAGLTPEQIADRVACHQDAQ